MLQLLVTTYNAVYSPNLKVIRANRKLKKYGAKKMRYDPNGMK